MEQSIADIADRYTILLLKRDNGLDVEEELQECKSHLDGVDYCELSKINGLMWDIEEKVTGEISLERVGVYYLALRGLTMRRAEAKNKITEEHGGHLEQKKY